MFIRTVFKATVGFPDVLKITYFTPNHVNNIKIGTGKSSIEALRYCKITDIKIV